MGRCNGQECKECKDEPCMNVNSMKCKKFTPPHKEDVTMRGESNLYDGGRVGLSATHLIIDFPKDQESACKTWCRTLGQKCKDGANCLATYLCCFGLQQTSYVPLDTGVYDTQWKIRLDQLTYAVSVADDIKQARYTKCTQTVCEESVKKMYEDVVCCNPPNRQFRSKCDECCEVGWYKVCEYFCKPVMCGTPIVVSKALCQICEVAICNPAENIGTGLAKGCVNINPKRKHKLMFTLPDDDAFQKEYIGRKVTLSLYNRYPQCRSGAENPFFERLKQLKENKSIPQTADKRSRMATCGQIVCECCSILGPAMDVLEVVAEVALICIV